MVSGASLLARVWTRGGFAARLCRGAAVPLHERAVLADQQFEVLALLVGELEEDLLALGVLEALAVALEEAVRAALAADADAIGLEIVDAVAAQLLGAGREQAVGRALEEQERRPRLELRILLEQLLVALLERLRGDALLRSPACGRSRARADPSPAAPRARRTPGRCARWQWRCAARRARTAARSLARLSAGARPVRQASHVP